MGDTRYWSKAFRTNFINEYRSHSCLWKIKSKEYYNKDLKNAAYDKLVELCKTINPEANRDFVCKKIQSLRRIFRKEFRKVTDSKRTDDVHVPRLWYYDLLLFTKDQEEFSTEDQRQNETKDPSELIEDSIAQENDDIEITNSKEETEIRKSRKRQNSSAETKEFMEMCNVALNVQPSQPSVSEFDGIGISVARKLQRMDPTQAIYAESIIHLVLRKGLFNSLTNKTSLCNG